MSNRIAILEGYDSMPRALRGSDETTAACMSRCERDEYERRYRAQDERERAWYRDEPGMTKERKVKKKRSAAQKAADKKAGRRMRRAVKACKGKKGDARSKCMARNLKK